jgi:hypothetical protein
VNPQLFFIISLSASSRRVTHLAWGADTHTPAAALHTQHHRHLKKFRESPTIQPEP